MKTSITSLFTVVQANLLILAVVFSVPAAGEIDPSFNPGLIQVTYAAGSVNKTVVRRVVTQPDGKILLAGLFRAVHKSAANAIVRLNLDGTVDPTFRGPEIFGFGGTTTFTIYAVALQSDGKILIGGNFVTVAGTFRPGIARLNSDGSHDPDFATAANFNLEGFVRDIEVGADDKITLGGSFIYGVPSAQKFNLVRVLADGTLDSSFGSQSITSNQTAVLDILLLPGDKTLISLTGVIGQPGGNIHRLDVTGTVEWSLAANGFVRRFARQADGKLLIGGDFTTFNGFPFPAGIVRLNTNDSIDTSFTPPSLPGDIYDIEILSAGKILLGGWLTPDDLVLLNSDGTQDNSFDYAGPLVNVFDLGVQLDGKIVVGAEANEFGPAVDPPLLRVSATGSLDAVQIVVGNNGRAQDIFIQPDGKILAGGFFNHADGGFRRNIARLSENGVFDASFASNLFSNEIYAVDMLPSGTIVTGADNTYSKLSQSGTVQFSNGGFIYDLKPLADGRLLVAINHFLRRVNSDNGVDSTFNVPTDAPIRRILIQPDGKILVAGFFTQINGAVRGRIARLNADGTLDTSFNPPGGANGLVSDMALQSDGKIVIGGQFTSVNFFNNHRFLARLHSNGALDETYNPGVAGEVSRLKLQPDGRILVGGVDIINGVGRNTVRRFYPNGTVDPSFSLGSGTDGPIRSIEFQAGNKILIGGEFRTVNGIERLGIARLLNTPSRTLFDYDGDGRADVSVFRPSENKWYILRSSDGQVDQPIFAIAGDVPVPADYDGDGKTDVAIFRPSNGQWWYKSTLNGGNALNTFGQMGDIPRPSDFDGDGLTDLVLFRPSTNSWIRYGSQATHVPIVEFGLSGDQPLVGDFDGDGKSDLAVFRPSNGDWWYAATSAGGAFRNVHWGQNGDVPVPADYDGDGKTDFAVYRPLEGGWYVYNSGNGSFTTLAFGTSGDRPAAADYDGDGRADIAVFRPSTGVWYLLNSSSGFAGARFGISTDQPTPSAFVP